MNRKPENDRRIYTLSTERPEKAVLKMGIPVTLGMLFMVAYNLVDTYFVGLLHDDYQLAATNLAYPVMMVVIALSGIAGNGGASYLARCLGADYVERPRSGLSECDPQDRAAKPVTRQSRGDGAKKEEAERTLSISIELIVLAAIALTVLGLIFIDPVVRLLGATENTFQYTKDYVQVMFIGSIFTMDNYAIGQLLRAEGSTMYSMIGMIGGTVANIVLDPLFIFTFGMEIKGAAIATILGNAIGMFIVLWFYIRKKTLLELRPKLEPFDKKIVSEIMWVGIPHTFEQFFSTAAIIVNNNLARSYGDLTVAAMGISGKIMSFGNYIYQGMAAGCQPLMGFNYGAKNYERMKKLIRTAIIETGIIELIVMGLYGVFAPTLIGLFSQTEEVIRIGAVTLRAAMLMLPFVGATSIVRNTFNAIGKPFYAFGITVVRQLVLYIPFLLLFNRLWGYTGLIHAQPAEEVLCMAFSLLLLAGVFSRMMKEAKQ